MRKLKLFKSLLVVATLLVGGTNAWATAVPYNVGTEGTGDAWGSRKYSDAYEIAPGEIYHFTFTNTSYGSNNWNNWLLDCTDGSLVEGKPADGTTTWYFTMRSDNHGWGTNYNATMRYADFVWADFQTVMNGATVDMYVDYNSTDKIIRTYATITKSETTWHYNFASKAIDVESVFLFLSEELAVLNITKAEKVASLPDGTYGIYKRSITDGYGYTWDTNTSNPDYTGWTNTNGTKTLDLTDGIKWTGKNKSTGSIATTISPSDGCVLNVEADFFLKGITGSSDTRPDEAYFRFGNIIIYEDAQYNKLSYVLDGTTTVSSSGDPIGTTFFTGSNTNVRNTGVSFKLVMEINTKTNMLTSMNVYTHGDLVTPKLNLSGVALSEPNYTNIAVGFIRTRSDGNPIANLKNITVTETPQNITLVDYTVKFQDALGNELKADVVHDNGVVGDVYQATATDMETFYDNADESLATKKYIYKSGQNTSVVATSNAAANVITLVFDVHDKTAYTVKAQASGSDLTTLASGSAYFDSSTMEYWNKYINVSDQWYVANETTYGAAITASTINVAYTATNDLDYFYEVESDMTISKTYGDGYSGTATSKGGAITLYASANAYTKTTVSAGVYNISVGAKKWADNYADTYEFAYSTDNTNWIPLGRVTYDAGTEGVRTLENAIIPTEAYVRIWATMGSQTPRRYLDYMTLKKTAEIPTSVSATIGVNGYSTFASPYPLDLTTAKLPTGVKAYKAAVSGTTVTFTELNQTVPANTGILLEGTAEPVVNLTVVASGTAVEGNAFLVNTSGATFDADANFTYYGMMKATTADEPIVFGTFNPASVAIPADKAYLKVASNNARLNVVFSDEATGIKTVQGEGVTVNGYYDLQGRRVAQPAKGLYIVNGKKMVVK